MQSFDNHKTTKYDIKWQRSVCNAEVGDIVTFGRYSWYIITVYNLSIF